MVTTIQDELSPNSKALILRRLTSKEQAPAKERTAVLQSQMDMVKSVVSRMKAASRSTADSFLQSRLQQLVKRGGVDEELTE